MVEIDLNSMYTNIPKDAAMEAVVWFLSLLRDKWRRWWVSVHKVDKRLDRVGCGTTRDYVNITFQQLHEFVRYDLYQNHLAHSGQICFSKTRVCRWAAVFHRR